MCLGTMFQSPSTSRSSTTKTPNPWHHINYQPASDSRCANQQQAAVSTHRPRAPAHPCTAEQVGEPVGLIVVDGQFHQ